MIMYKLFLGLLGRNFVYCQDTKAAVAPSGSFIGAALSYNHEQTFAKKFRLAKVPPL